MLINEIDKIKYSNNNVNLGDLKSIVKNKYTTIPKIAIIKLVLESEIKIIYALKIIFSHNINLTQPFLFISRILKLIRNPSNINRASSLLLLNTPINL